MLKQYKRQLNLFLSNFIADQCGFLCFYICFHFCAHVSSAILYTGTLQGWQVFPQTVEKPEKNGKENVGVEKWKKTGKN